MLRDVYGGGIPPIGVNRFPLPEERCVCVISLADETENSPTYVSQKLDGLCLVVPKDDRQKQIYIYDLKMWTKAGASVSLGEARWFAAGR